MEFFKDLAKQLDATSKPKTHVPIIVTELKKVKQRLPLATSRFASYCPNEQKLQELADAMRCVTCDMTPNPEYYLVCKENGHFVCGYCAWHGTPPNPCCDPNNLETGSAQLLNAILRGSEFRCKNHASGCQYTGPTHAWMDHVRLCDNYFRNPFPLPKFMDRVMQCYAPKCYHTEDCIENLVKHLGRAHSLGEVLVPSGIMTQFVVPIHDSSAEPTDEACRHLVLLNSNLNLFLFASEMRGELVHAWVWAGAELSSGAPHQFCLTLVSIPDKDSVVKNELEFTGTCLPYEMSPNVIIEQGACLTFTRTQALKQYRTPSLDNHSFLISVSVKLHDCETGNLLNLDDDDDNE